MLRSPFRAGIALSLLLLIAACSAAPAATSSGSGAAVPPQASGPGISIEEALASTADQPLLVNGALFADATGLRLCSIVLESYPPQCGGAVLQVHGLDLSTVPDLKTEQGLSWSEAVQLLGRVSNGVLTIEATAM